MGEKKMGSVFNEEAGRRLESLYVTADAVRRREAVLCSLQLARGEQVLDIGTGPGFLAREMADRVGPSGKILGLDISDPVLELARKRCADRENVSFQKGEATDLPVAGDLFDAAVSVQVFEYVPEVGKALSEMYRSLRPGGRGVIVATDWSSIAWHSSNKERMNRVLSAFEGHCAHSDLPRTLSAKLSLAGFRIKERKVLSQFNPAYDSNTYSHQMIDSISTHVIGRNGVTEAEAGEWAKDLRELGETGEYFFCLNQFLFSIEKPLPDLG
jgi:arsenite methyltransferase